MLLQGASLCGRLTPPSTLAQEGKKAHQITVRSGQRSMIEYSFFILIVVANWRLDNAESLDAMLQGQTARTPQTLRIAGGCRTYVHTRGSVLNFFF